MRERRLGEHVVGEPVREPRHRVRGQRGDDEQVGTAEMRIRIGPRSFLRERVERLGGDEALGAPRRQRRERRARRGRAAG